MMEEEKNVFKISILNKKAKNSSKIRYVCGNSDYTVVFDFDQEWNEHPVKTARFIPDGGAPIDTVFTGNQCLFPKIMEAVQVEVGVYSGDLKTTTPATVDCMRSILSGTKQPEQPKPDLYAQIMAGLNEIVNLGIPDKADKAIKAAASAAESASSAAASEEAAEKAAMLAQQDLDEKGWLYVEDREDGHLYLITSTNAPDDFTLMDNGEGRLVAVYG